MKTKTQLERFSYEEVKQRNQIALQNAEGLRKKARTTPHTLQSESEAMTFQQNEMHVTRLLENAKLETQYANSLIEVMDDRREKVKSALQRETALKRLANTLEEGRRQSRNKREETQHEHVRSMTSGKRAT